MMERTEPICLPYAHWRAFQKLFEDSRCQGRDPRFISRYHFAILFNYEENWVGKEVHVVDDTIE